MCFPLYSLDVVACLTSSFPCDSNDTTHVGCMLARYNNVTTRGADAMLGPVMIAIRPMHVSMKHE